jgi:hypothetical protein
MLPTAGVPAAPVAGAVGDADVGSVAGGDVTGALLVAGPVGDDELTVAGAEGDVLVDGDECVGVGDCRALVVGLGEWVAAGLFDAVLRLVLVA